MEKYIEYKFAAERVTTESEYSELIKKVECDSEITARQYLAIKHIALDSLYENK